MSKPTGDGCLLPESFPHSHPVLTFGGLTDPVFFPSRFHRRRRLRFAWLAALGVIGACSSGGDGSLFSASSTAGGVAPSSAPVSTAPAPSTSATSTTSPTPSTAVSRAASSSAGLTSIEVASTTSQYFVLYVKPMPTGTLELPVAIAKGQAGTTTLSDGRSQLLKDRYRVATFSVDQPGDVDGDGIDDLTELADPAANPLNAAKKLPPRDGAVIISSVEAYSELSYQGNDVGRDSYLAGLEFMKFVITGTNTAHPSVYFMNTNTWKAHPQFMSSLGLPGGGQGGPTAGVMRGDIVYDAKATAPDGSKGTYRFAFQPNDAYAFSEIAIAYETLVASMPMLQNNLLYYPFPQSALPLYKKEKAQYDAYRIPVMID